MDFTAPPDHLTLLAHDLAEAQGAFAEASALLPVIAQAAVLMQESLSQGGALLICGNGGSAADAQHFAAELTGRFERERPGKRAIALHADTSALTAIGNDYGFEQVFARQVEALGRPGDCLIAISTSGNSPNVCRAVEQAHKGGLQTIGLLGRDGGALAAMCQVAVTVPHPRTARIQEVHGFIIHCWCALLDRQAAVS